ncbi:protein EMBRYO DEFECTIVE 1674 [Arachis duranensis]|uniref:Protein EMBRYO DEFECTIVE 1674 n=1 Tax=Arachis duranensis TaxID=130453 RepID=A0A9C6WFF4_ARADU|nr:protein EMBRYO DEFECTIVE 1674 [Arachis duranensis]XP_052107777.1 protein EMBRYO DEFECTIVE 1674 [Arachis duranensis]
MSTAPLFSHERHLSPLKYVFLSDWWLAKPCLPLQGLAVGGIAYGLRERMLLSTVIAKRHEANVLETEDGVTLHLSSLINSSRSSQNGFPRKVCEDFLLGFPDDWQKYTAHSFGAKCVNGDTGFHEPNACSRKRAVDAIPFSIHDNRSAERHDFSSSNDGILKAKTNICNEPENSIGNVLKQSVSKNSVECSNSKKTVEGEREDNSVSLKSSQSLVDTRDDCENGVLVAAPVSQVGNPNSDRSLTGVFDRIPCKVHSGKSMVGSPVSTTKIRATQSLGDCKEEYVSHTRKYSKKSLTSLKETSTCPVRRSPRLSKATK